MTSEELRSIMDYLRKKVTLEEQEGESTIKIKFQTPEEREMIEAGLNASGVKRILKVPWWEEMVNDIVETPEMCDPDDPPEQVLEFARDVISEYIRKRFPLNE
jgi:hypothetical protein